MAKIVRNIVYTRMVYGRSYGTSRFGLNSKEIKFDTKTFKKDMKLYIFQSRKIAGLHATWKPCLDVKYNLCCNAIPPSQYFYRTRTNMKQHQ